MIAKNKTGKALARLIEEMGRSEVEWLLGEWNGSELSEDGKTIVYFDRRSDTDKWTQPKSEFFIWLFSDEPLDPAHYSQDEEWQGRVRQAREIAMTV